MRQRLSQLDPEGVADGDYGVTVASDIITGLVEIPAAATTRLANLVTAINGVPEPVWDANNEQVITEVPL